MLTTTTAGNNTTTLEKETILMRSSEQFAVSARQKNKPFNLNLKKLYLYASVIGEVVAVLGLLIAFKNQNVIMIECFKALSIVGCLNLIRVSSIS